MTNPTGFLEFHKWARENALSYALNYWEGEDVFEIRIHSPAPAEEFYMKRCYDLQDFIRAWREHMKQA